MRSSSWVPAQREGPRKISMHRHVRSCQPSVRPGTVLWHAAGGRDARASLATATLSARLTRRVRACRGAVGRRGAACKPGCLSSPGRPNRRQQSVSFKSGHGVRSHCHPRTTNTSVPLYPRHPPSSPYTPDPPANSPIRTFSTLRRVHPPRPWLHPLHAVGHVYPSDGFFSFFSVSPGWSFPRMVVRRCAFFHPLWSVGAGGGPCQPRAPRPCAPRFLCLAARRGSSGGGGGRPATGVARRRAARRAARPLRSRPVRGGSRTRRARAAHADAVLRTAAGAGSQGDGGSLQRHRGGCSCACQTEARRTGRSVWVRAPTRRPKTHSRTGDGTPHREKHCRALQTVTRKPSKVHYW